MRTSNSPKLIALYAALLGCSSTVTPTDDAAADVTADIVVVADVAADVATDRPVDAGGRCALPGGGSCPFGSTCPLPDNCNVCACSPTGVVECTGRACLDASVADAVRPPDAPRTCLLQSDCGASEECYGPPGCATAWTCVPRLGRACTRDLVPYCGCAGGATFMSSSTCPDRPYQHMGACSMAEITCTLPSGARCPQGMTCPLGDGCNDCTCASPGTLTCTARPCAFDAGPPRPTCHSNLDCHADEECAGPEGCGTPWACRPATGRLCPNDAVAWCGCDGVTFYGSSLCPPEPYASRGACGATDGGAPAIDCDPNHTTCGGIPPACPSGQVPRVERSCWNGCVAFESCAPIACDPSVSRLQCPPSTVCSPTTRVCARL